MRFILNNDMIGRTGMVDSFNVSLSASFIRKKIRLQAFASGIRLFLPDDSARLALSETLKLSTIPVLPIMSLFNQFSTGSVNEVY